MMSTMVTAYPSSISRMVACEPMNPRRPSPGRGRGRDDRPRPERDGGGVPAIFGGGEVQKQGEEQRERAHALRGSR